MDWFGGCAPGAPPAVPAGARLVWSDPPLWTVGNWDERLVRTVNGEQGARLAVFGACAATRSDLVRTLADSRLARSGGLWPGSYTVVRRDKAGDVEVFADAASACPLYVARTARGAVWGSSSLALSGLTGGKPDTEWLAAFLNDKQSPLPGRSAWAGVEPLGAGQRLRLSTGGTSSVSPWWLPERRSYAAAVHLVAQALTEGVRAHVEGMAVSSDLAGVDSTTVTVLAADHGPVLAMTVHPDGVTEGGDMQYARALTIPGLTRTAFPLQAEHLPFTTAPVGLPATDEPAPSSGVWAMLSAQLRQAADAGARVHLTGDGGDNLFIAPPAHLADLARRGRLLRLSADALAWAQLRRMSPWPLLAMALRRDVPRLARPWLARPAWLLADVPPAAAAAARVTNADEVLITDVRGAARSAYADVQLAAALGVKLTNPYFDQALLDAVVSVPSWERFAVHRYKPMLLDAIGYALPLQHRARATKGTFAGDFHRGVRVNLPRLLSLADGRLAELGLIDPEPLRDALRRVALGVESVWPPILAALAAEMWLRAADATTPTAWTTLAVAR
ncbi:albusnodin/ikarugamycin family macrolactam cyclase [Actinacidiphila glaucinigra]|uniref:albusnodin/ikarugamycin family macrolactam cyclase n=1 Tax=Actinacidiphila glaucinigra TaxID=235986 RepID=UPI0036B18C07